jgi:hypothetical protein
MMRFSAALAILMLTSGCANNAFFHTEPNPETATPGFGYVDFVYSASEPAPCRWQVYQRQERTALVGSKYFAEVRLDDHAYLAEMVAKPHRLVRVESRPGRHEFKVECVSDRGSYFTIEVRDSEVTPVFLSALQFTSTGTLSPLVGASTGFEVIANTARDRSYTTNRVVFRHSTQPPVAYKKKEEMPYYRP